MEGKTHALNEFLCSESEWWLFCSQGGHTNNFLEVHNWSYSSEHPTLKKSSFCYDILLCAFV